MDSDVAKAAMDFGEAHVEDAEVDLAMRLVWNPSGGLRHGQGTASARMPNANANLFIDQVLSISGHGPLEVAGRDQRL